jgi:hypothetical protein
MPPLTATAEHVKPFLAPVKERGVGAEDCATNFCQDNWLEKVFDRQDGMKAAKTHKHKHNFIQRTLESMTHYHSKGGNKHGKNAHDDPSYKEELQQYIAESTANLRYGDDELLGSSDEDTSDGDSEPLSISPRNAEIIDFSESSVSMDEYVYVKPPVEVPRSYRVQDRDGGVLVAGERVLFTNWAFKRQMRHMGRLGPLPERGEAASYAHGEAEEVFAGVYAGKIVEL